MMKRDQAIQQINFIRVAEDLEKTALTVGQKEKKIAEGPLWLRIFYYIFSSENTRLLPLGQACNALLDQVEKVAVIFSSDESKTNEQNQCYAACLKTAKSAGLILSASASGKVRSELGKLTQRIAALQYRIEAVNGGLERTAVDPVLTETLRAAAIQWKQDHPLIVKHEITDQEIKKLEEASSYPEFAHVMLTNKPLKESFFTWALRDNNAVRQFVEFPAICARLKSSYLASRTGKLAGKLQIEKRTDDADGLQKKFMSLPFYMENETTETVSILDESREVVLNGGLRITINNVFKVFANKNREIGDLEILDCGIMNWNSHEMGSRNPETGGYDRIDLSLDDYWKQLPILEEITKEQLESRISETLSDKEWVVFAKSSRTTPDMDLDGRHGYFEIAIPTDKGTYCMYPFGIFPIVFPNTILELALFLGNTFKAKVSYPDENFFYSHRQQATHPFKLTDSEAKVLMKTLQKELIMARYGHQIFQFGAENCAYWSQHVLNTIEAKKHNFYKLDYVESYPLNPVLKKIFSLFRSMPACIRNYTIRIVDRCFGTSRGVTVFDNRQKVFKSHNNSPVRNEFVIYQPGYLHRQIEKKEIKGYLSLGNC